MFNKYILHLLYCIVIFVRFYALQQLQKIDGWVLMPWYRLYIVYYSSHHHSISIIKWVLVDIRYQNNNKHYHHGTIHSTIQIVNNDVFILSAILSYYFVSIVVFLHIDYINPRLRLVVTNFEILTFRLN